MHGIFLGFLRKMTKNISTFYFKRFCVHRLDFSVINYIREKENICNHINGMKDDLLNYSVDFLKLKYFLPTLKLFTSSCRRFDYRIYGI